VLPPSQGQRSDRALAKEEATESASIFWEASHVAFLSAMRMFFPWLRLALLLSMPGNSIIAGASFRQAVLAGSIRPHALRNSTIAICPNNSLAAWELRTHSSSMSAKLFRRHQIESPPTYA
jgi:hypothetical protein